jgi:hypothetical protein
MTDHNLNLHTREEGFTAENAQGVSKRALKL